MTYERDYHGRPKTGWEDMKFPASAVRIQGGQPTDPTWDDANGGWKFAVDDVVFLQGQFPHAWLEGSRVKPHCHAQRTTTGAGGNINWKLEYRHTPIGEVWGDFVTITTADAIAGRDT